MRPLLALLLLLTLACGGVLPGQDDPPPTQPSATAEEPLPDGVALPPHDAAQPDITDPCLTPIPTPPMQGCTMGTISCGQTIEGSNEFGTRNFGDDFYQGKYCTPQRSDYEDSPEAIYTLEVPGDIRATITLTSECADLDLAAVFWTDPSRCPTIKHNINECEMDTHSGSGAVTVATVTRAQTFLVIVDGKDGQTGNFSLKVECDEYR